jgi:hypothetical protein
MKIGILIIGSCHLTRAFKTNGVELLTVLMIQDIAIWSWIIDSTNDSGHSNMKLNYWQ